MGYYLTIKTINQGGNMELILAGFYLTGIFAILFIVTLLVLLYMVYEATISFVTDHWGPLLLMVLIFSVIVAVIPVRRAENKGFVTLSGNTLTARNYLEFIGGLAIISFWGYVLYSLIAEWIA